MWKLKWMNDDNTYTVYLGLGSNMGNRSQALQRAADSIALLPATRLLRCSGIYETEPWGDEAQEPFLNCVVEIRTQRQPEQLLEDVKAIEIELGRMPSRKYGPRSIDIDILLYEGRTIALDHLHIPHPLMTARRFVLVPLNDLTDSACHPEDQRTISELINVCADPGMVSLTNIHLHLS